MTILTGWTDHRRAGLKKLAILVDPDDAPGHIHEVAETAMLQGVGLFLVGGSLLTKGRTEDCVKQLRSMGVPQIVLFPGQEIQVVREADAILFMSLISGRNPEFLIGKQVSAAPWVRKAGLTTIPTGYMLIESGKMTSAVYMSHTMPLPADKPDIAATTAMAGEMLGLQVFYMDAGSGATHPVKPEMIAAVRRSVQGVVFVGGGIRTAEAAEKAWVAGADVVVVGNGVFEDIGILSEISAVCQKMNTRNIGV